ncbi:hypothetical protein BWZ20_00095 [Winogradskyella sp. J14-2]|uniref:DUF1643 domain-containing protein n=1 Tax=Winogradskyella sp. J14-2 TaxID=1936080 RepID=UPI000972CAFF|nr:DUF1643 domain-containing protein [Winogradskyella sp. J14-2]APY06794.1 hypothetical protein BWZ20_00095 [Winogradskyella sp. J14-2]
MKYYCLPENDNEKRFALGIKGKRNLLCIALNPNTANAEKLDGTTRNLERIARDNGYDGWLMTNLYPTRNPKGNNLLNEADEKLFWENIQSIDTLVSSKELNIKDVLLGWGDDIKAKPYFSPSIYAIYDRLNKHGLNYYAFRVNQSGNPSHPSPMTINTKYKSDEKIKLTEFDFHSYAKQFKPMNFQ